MRERSECFVVLFAGNRRLRQYRKGRADWTKPDRLGFRVRESCPRSGAFAAPVPGGIFQYPEPRELQQSELIGRRRRLRHDSIGWRSADRTTCHQGCVLTAKLKGVQIEK